MEETTVIAIHFTDGEVLELGITEEEFERLDGEITSNPWVEIDGNTINTATIKYFWFYEIPADEEAGEEAL
ncbi:MULTISPECIES: hypothetical protein [Saccharibacillus]|uniref:Uncharacterized protein n=1 Tax=Saccharibacillus brassicae TaxID=2583377 RepID=A0A4Y6UTY7_SACBS|nr:MULTISPECIES: hypothetical protein [Saccharibacillus]MWJ32163.1 hypothetical protein [Saccharibacillus sp. WB 17]QDH19821.1 hypothetical protein FFV09_02425 [Saccharibacillus brassicae]